MEWSEKKVKDLEKAGKIRGYKVTSKGPSDKSKRIPNNKAKAIIWLELNLPYWAKEKGQQLETEFKFSPDRNYRSDWALPALKILIEYEGGIYRQRGAHNSPTAIQRDIDKYALAHKLGYTVIRLTAKNFKTVFEQLNELIKTS